MREIEQALNLAVTVKMQNYTIPLMIIMSLLPLFNIAIALLLHFS